MISHLLSPRQRMDWMIPGYTTQVSFFDYDLDGDLDCFIINNSPISLNSLNYANQRDLPDADWPVAICLKRRWRPFTEK